MSARYTELWVWKNKSSLECYCATFGKLAARMDYVQGGCTEKVYELAYPFIRQSSGLH